MESSHGLEFIALGFALFGVILLLVPVWLVATRTRPWREVVGLWIAGWGFLSMGVGVYLAPRGFGVLVGIGVFATAVGQIVQHRATRSGRS